MLDMLFLLAILGMLITRKQYTTQEVEKRSKKGTKRVVPIVPSGEDSGGRKQRITLSGHIQIRRIMIRYKMKIYGHRNCGKG